MAKDLIIVRIPLFLHKSVQEQVKDLIRNIKLAKKPDSLVSYPFPMYSKHLNAIKEAIAARPSRLNT
jgi:hypothetical protein